MEIMLDTANLQSIRMAIEIFPISGVTTNPSIISREKNIDFYDQLRKIRSLIGCDRSLHVQVLGSDCQTIVNEAESLTNIVDKQIYIKVPVNSEGLKAIRILKSKGFNVTATCIFTKMQAILAILSGADYIAPYINRMANLDIEPYETLSFIQDYIVNHKSNTKIVAASFKNISQLTSSINCGIAAMTVEPTLLYEIFNYPAISNAIGKFREDFVSVYGTKTLDQL